MNSPYKIKPLSHLSASAIRDFMVCEAKSAYARGFYGVPKVPRPISMSVGVMYHWLLENFGQLLWKKAQEAPEKYIGPNDHKNWIGYGGHVMTEMLEGKIGSRGPGTRPEVVRWSSDRRRDRMTEEQYQEALKQEKSKYIGMTYLMLEAFRQQFTVPLPFHNLHFEYNIRRPEARLVSEQKKWQFDLHGSIDLVEEFKGGYNVIDYKSGWIITKYKDRINLIEDIQMSLYWHAMRNIVGQPPSGLIIQPLEFSSKDLDDHGPDTLRNLRIHLPPRNHAAYFEEIMKLAEDIHFMADSIRKPQFYSDEDRNSWEPKSSYAKKAEFVDSVREQRYKPRIGPWCDNCQYASLCPKDHPEDWALNERLKTEVIEGAGEVPPQQLVPQQPVEVVPRLFEEPPYRSPYVRKADKAVINDMLETKKFLKKHKVQPTLNKIINLMKQTGECPCTELKLFPVWIFPFVPQFLATNGHADITQVCKQCPDEHCPRNKVLD